MARPGRIQSRGGGGASTERGSRAPRWEARVPRGVRPRRFLQAPGHAAATPKHEFLDQEYGKA